jgi:hypothetical protein
MCCFLFIFWVLRKTTQKRLWIKATTSLKFTKMSFYPLLLNIIIINQNRYLKENKIFCLLQDNIYRNYYFSSNKNRYKFINQYKKIQKLFEI